MLTRFPHPRTDTAKKKCSLTTIRVPVCKLEFFLNISWHHQNNYPNIFSLNMREWHIKNVLIRVIKTTFFFTKQRNVSRLMRRRRGQTQWDALYITLNTQRYSLLFGGKIRIQIVTLDVSLVDPMPVLRSIVTCRRATTPTETCARKTIGRLDSGFFGIQRRDTVLKKITYSFADLPSVR